jgi:hypothetical protein
MNVGAEHVKIYPTMAGRVAIADAKACLVEIIFARDLAEAQAGVVEGAALPGVPLGMTANQCRELAADLMNAANTLDGKRGVI